MPSSPTSPTWGTPTLLSTGDTPTTSWWNTIANDVALLYAKPWIKWTMTSGWQEIPHGAGIGNTIFNTGGTGAAAYSMLQNDPLSGAGSFSYSSSGTGMFSLPSMSGLYRVYAKCLIFDAEAITGRMAVLWYSSGSVVWVDVGYWQSAPSGQYTTLEVHSQYPGNSSYYGNVDSFSVSAICAGSSSHEVGAYDPNSSTLLPSGTPPYTFAGGFAEWVGSAGTF